MATPVLKKFDFEFSEAVMVRDILPGAGWAPYRAAAPARVRKTRVRKPEELRPSHEEDWNFINSALAGIGQ
jgi:hypothetical protein